jgi:hypothetical protein
MFFEPYRDYLAGSLSLWGSYNPREARAMNNPNTINTRIIVSAAWLKACGLEHLIDVPLAVSEIKDFGHRGKFYTVTTWNKQFDFSSKWEVWDHRGITIVE